MAAKKKSRREKLPRKGEFVAQQLAKGRSRKQAEHDWWLKKTLRGVYRRQRSRDQWRNRSARRAASARGNAAHQRHLNRLLSRRRKLDRAEVEAQITAHYRLLGLHARAFFWLGGPAELTHPVPRSPSYLAKARAAALFAPGFGRRQRSPHRQLVDSLYGPQLTDPEAFEDTDRETFWQLRRASLRFRTRRRRAQRPVPRLLLPIAVPHLSARKAAKPLLAAAKAGLLAFWPLKRGQVAVLPQPELKREAGRLHCADGPAVCWPNGERLFFWRGICVPDYVVMAPEKIAVEQIESVQNVELRRIMIDRYGAERYLREAGAIKLDESEYGTLWAKPQLDDETVVMVEVVNHTAEPDGSRKHYFLPVPPQVRTAREAVAWTFRMHPDDYLPTVAT